jgi:hypothetical protein
MENRTLGGIGLQKSGTLSLLRTKRGESEGKGEKHASFLYFSVKWEISVRKLEWKRREK